MNKAVNIVVNAKVSRPSVCNAADAILIDRKVAGNFLKKLRPEFEKYEVEIFADNESYDLLNGYSHLSKAKPEDFGKGIPEPEVRG
jgi:glutamate-5-semialdehyde dehydrogenase